MAIGRLYYYTLSILTLGFCCVTHYHMWPEKGYAPHKNVGNKHRKDPKEQKKEQKKKEKERKKRESEHRRRKAESEDDEPEWIADFNSKRKTGTKPAEIFPLSTPIPTTETTGRPRRVSFEDEQPPNVSGQRNGNIANGYVPYDYIYGQGAVRANGGARPHGVRSPPGAPGYGQHDGSLQSPNSNNRHSVRSPPTTSDRSKHATVQSNSDTVSPVPVKGGYATPGSRPFSADAGPD